MGMDDVEDTGADVAAESPDDTTRPSVNGFAEQIAAELKQTESEIRKLSQAGDFEALDLSLRHARKVVQELHPVPQFIWRISNYVLGRPGRVNKVSEGNLFGLKKLVLNIGKDRILGKGTPMLTTRAVIDSVPSDVIAASAVVHAICRKLQTKDFQAVWGPILDDALMRTQIGYFIGAMTEDFGSGRGMLAGLAGRIGLVVLVATGNADQAQASITLLAGGSAIEKVALEIYGCEPIHVAALLLSAAGCGRDAVLGVSSFTLAKKRQLELNKEQSRWLAALSVTEHVRTGALESISEETWALMGYEEAAERDELGEIVVTLKRRGHGWNWMV